MYKDKQQAIKRCKEIKENHIKEIAEKYKNLIPKKLYETMINYKLKIEYED